VLKAHFAEVDKTVEYVDRLNIPWWGGESNTNAFDTGRVTSFTTMSYNKRPELFMLVWWDQAQPTKEEMEAAIAELLEDIDDDIDED
jgi:hypothetical protein